MKGTLQSTRRGTGELKLHEVRLRPFRSLSSVPAPSLAQSGRSISIYWMNENTLKCGNRPRVVLWCAPGDPGGQRWRLDPSPRFLPSNLGLAKLGPSGAVSRGVLRTLLSCCAPLPSWRAAPRHHPFPPRRSDSVGVSREPAPSPERSLSLPPAASSPWPRLGPGLGLCLILILRAAAAVAHQGRRTHGASSTTAGRIREREHPEFRCAGSTLPGAGPG